MIQPGITGMVIRDADPFKLEPSLLTLAAPRNLMAESIFDNIEFQYYPIATILPGETFLIFHVRFSKIEKNG